MLLTSTLTASKSRKGRNRNGSILLLVVISMAILLPVCLVGGVALTQLNLNQARHMTAVETASLTAASDLSRIVVNDPYFGYIALTDFAPIGRNTRAEDGESLPVLGINTLWATCRNEVILADLIDNNELRVMASTELEQARRATKLLSATLEAALLPGSSGKFHDIDGAVVCPYEHAKQILSENSNQFLVQGTPKLGSLKLSLGWIDEATDSGTPIPQPLPMANVSKEQTFAENYRASINIPSSGEDFYFAALGNQPSLVSEKRFKHPDGKRVCSIVRAEVDLVLPPQKTMQLLVGCEDVSVRASACAEPRANLDTSIPGIMRLGFEDGLVPQLSSIRALLNNSRLGNSQAEILTAVNGDYPNDPGSQLSANSSVACNRSITSIVALGLFDWLRSTHNKARLDAVVSMIDSPFPVASPFDSGAGSKPILIYELDGHGNVLTTNQPQNPFLDEAVSHNQECARSANAYATTDNHWSFYFRDQVRNVGITRGGKHAGEAMPPNPLNWSELPSYGRSSPHASLRLKGGNARGLTITGDSKGCPEGSGGISLQSAQFQSIDGLSLPIQPRKTYYSGGLAVEFRFLLATTPQEGDQ